MEKEQTLMNVTTAVANRRSTRDFLSKPVPLALVQEILNTALRAPSTITH